ncbi:hypothetical protein K450DRAFT_231581 [Umbelopsis ramanniana AG]|uniref:WW domain-containing protein n=1 Tax=Umbelopsis ramanniana AG TaxID=1314678 RepID=A0AAD5ED27_UMBRA|nr:uncharacterized protein K450DRAFT_231581 [Umbelopsis ramanniana AG]KAI8581498.1 hypothetical protein K450DRAFT_231581 [Umbelopsis ramanniana AG]
MLVKLQMVAGRFCHFNPILKPLARLTVLVFNRYFIDLRTNTTTWDDPRSHPQQPYNMPSPAPSATSTYSQQTPSYYGSPNQNYQEQKGPSGSYQAPPYTPPVQNSYQQQQSVPPPYPQGAPGGQQSSYYGGQPSYQQYSSPPPQQYQQQYEQPPYQPAPYQQSPYQQPPPPQQQQQQQQQPQQGGNKLSNFLSGPNSGMKTAGMIGAGLLGGLVLGEVVEHHHDTGRW